MTLDLNSIIENGIEVNIVLSLPDINAYNVSIDFWLLPTFVDIIIVERQALVGYHGKGLVSVIFYVSDIESNSNCVGICD